MTQIICLEEKYSTTRLLTREQPAIEIKIEDQLESALFLSEGEGREGEGGLRTQDYFKVSQDDKLLITIITVVYNGAQFLEETIKSVIKQTHDNVEYIIIDGGSTDGTLDIIRQYENEIDYWVSEKDRGIYDAMNKGIILATGDWINFMNAGDLFYTLDTLKNTFYEKNYDDDILFGNVHIQYPDFSRIETAGNPHYLWRGMQFCHQSIFVRTANHKLNSFNINNLIAADLQFFYKAYQNNLKFRRLDYVISSVLTGGLSESNRIKTIIASRDAVCMTNCTILIRLFYTLRMCDSVLRSWLKLILPGTITRMIILRKK